MIGPGLTILLVIIVVVGFSACFVLAAVDAGKRYDGE